MDPTYNGFVTCINSVDGNVIWKNRIRGVFCSSVASAGNYIYFTDTKCQTTVIRNDDKFEIVAEDKLNEKMNSSIAIARDHLFIRTDKSLWCIGKK